MVEIEKINDLVVYSPTEAAIVEMRTKYMALSVAGLDDKQGYEACKKARIEVKGYRVMVDKQRKDFKKDALEYGRMVEAKAQAIIGPLEEIEAYLRAQQDVIDKEKQRQAEEAERKSRELFDYRQRELFKYRSMQYVSPEQLVAMDEEDFQALLSKVMDDYFAEQKKQEEENTRLAKLEAERKEHEAKISAQAEENRRLQAKIIKQQEDENNELLKKAALQKQKEAEEKAAREAREREAVLKIADEKLFAEIKAQFPTVELAWMEIARLRKSSMAGMDANKYQTVI